jgi:hypothetical protein
MLSYARDETDVVTGMNTHLTSMAFLIKSFIYVENRNKNILNFFPLEWEELQ